MFLVVTGNPLKGYRYIGPFPLKSNAELWATDHLNERHWWTSAMEAVKPST